MHTHELLLTFATAAALGVFLLVLADHLKISAITALLLGGILAGPEGLGLVDPHALGDGLGAIISLAVAIILFEGGLTLDVDGYRGVTKEIWRILSVGVLATWLGSTLCLRLICGFDWSFCLLASSLIIVTGPTVIGPLLHRIRVKKRLHHILHWEGVLIDPIGVFIALLCFEFYISTDGAHQLVAKDFLMRFVVGAVLGVAFGYLLDFILRRSWIGKGHTNIFVLVMAMINFAIADQIIAESGLLSVTISGLILGYRKTPQLREIVTYKVELKDFLIGLLFVLLAANLKLETFLHYGWKLPLLVAAIMFLVRPLNIFLSMMGSQMSIREKLFLSWIAPRGIVAASMASIFALKLGDMGEANASFLETFTYSMIAATVIIQGFTAGIVGKILGVLKPKSDGWIIVGAHDLGRKVAAFIKACGKDVVMVDSNAREVRQAQLENIVAFNEDAMHINNKAHTEFYGCGNLVALTTNPDLNRMLCHRWADLLDDGKTYRWEKEGYETEQHKHLLVGERIWSSHPPQRLLSHNGDDGAPIRVIHRGRGPLPDPAHILLTARGDTVSPQSPKKISPEDTSWLVYDPEQDKQALALPLAPQDILFSNSQTIRHLYREMLQHIQQKHPDIDPEKLLLEMREREEAYAGLMSNGIALPHTWSDAVDEALLVVARVRDGCPSDDQAHTIQLAFMLLSPSGDPQKHLHHVSLVARLIGTEAKRQALFAAESPAELFEVIAEG